MNERTWTLAVLAGVIVGGILLALMEGIEWVKRRTEDAMVYEAPDAWSLLDARDKGAREALARAMGVIGTMKSPCCGASLNAHGEGIVSQSGYTVALETYECSACWKAVEVDV